MHRATRLLTATIALIALGATSMAFVHRVGVGSRRLSPPAVAVDFTRLGRDARVPDYRHGVLVLTYHGIASDGSRYAVTPRHFAEQLATLRAAGFHAVSLAQVRALIEGRQPRLPPRPILVTFDDGPRTTWTAADPILARYGFRAAAFVITGRVASRSPSYYLTWGQLRAMRDSGRWEIESHTHAAHIFGLLPDGSHGPVLNNRVVEPGGQEETITHWRARVVEDLQASSRQIRTHLSVTPAAFAYPFSASGTRPTTRALPRSSTCSWQECSRWPSPIAIMPS